ncbi:PAS domain-containing protein [Acidobacteria bacterium AH-259-A15]|nr:PAS domain-containing protein [Acidobacteria bacterium AH-259-A15]
MPKHKNMPSGTLAEELMRLKEKTSWSWETISRELQRVMGERGPSSTTLFRYATGRVKRRNRMVERYVREGIDSLTLELMEKEVREREAEHKHAGKVVHETDVRFYQLVENARDIIYRYRFAPTRSFEYISPAVSDIVAYTPEEHYADPDLACKIVHPADRHKLQEYLQQGGVFGEPVALRWVHREGRLVWIEQVNVPVYDEAGNLVAMEGIARDISARKREEEALHSLVQGASWTVGQDFFPSLVRQLAAAFQVRFAFVSECHRTVEKSVRLLAFWEGTDWGENFEYNIERTPCEHVFTNNLAYYPAAVQKLFPEDRWLQEKDIESYLAVPVYDPNGNPRGHLGVMHDSPMAYDPHRESILRIFAARAGAELERKRT